MKNVVALTDNVAVLRHGDSAVLYRRSPQTSVRMWRFVVKARAIWDSERSKNAKLEWERYMKDLDADPLGNHTPPRKSILPSMMGTTLALALVTFMANIWVGLAVVAAVATVFFTISVLTMDGVVLEPSRAVDHNSPILCELHLFSDGGLDGMQAIGDKAHALSRLVGPLMAHPDYRHHANEILSIAASTPNPATVDKVCDGIGRLYDKMEQRETEMLTAAPDYGTDIDNIIERA